MRWIVSSSIGMRICSMESRSRSVTVPSNSGPFSPIVSKSIVTQNGVPAYIAKHASDHVSILNAGESDVSHPTQGLLDLLALRINRWLCPGDFRQSSSDRKR